MTKIEATPTDIVEQIRTFYDPASCHFLTLNGVALDENLIEVQWIFAPYEDPMDIILFVATITPDTLLPSIAEIIPSALLSQRELVDMFGLTIQDTQKGLYLDKDSLEKPLSLECAR
jgi:ech hydrogenase subunit D